MFEDGTTLAPAIIFTTLLGSPVVALALLCVFKGKRGKRALVLFGVSLVVLLAFAVYSYSQSCAPDVVGREGEADHASCAIGAFTWAPLVLIGAAIATPILLAVWERIEEVIAKRRG